jgi:hypothetical protein
MTDVPARPEPDRQRQTPPGLRCSLTPAAAHLTSDAEYVDELRRLSDSHTDRRTDLGQQNKPFIPLDPNRCAFLFAVNRATGPKKPNQHRRLRRRPCYTLLLHNSYWV